MIVIKSKKVFVAIGLLFFTIEVWASEKANCLKKKDATWVRGYVRMGYRRSDGTTVKSAYVRSHCRHYNKKELQRLPYLKNNKIEKWPHKEEFKEWNYEDKRRFLEATKDLPKALSHLKADFHRAKKSVFGYPNAGSTIPFINKIVLYDSAFLITNNLRDVIIHELAHFLYKQLSNDEISGYLKAAGWKLDKLKNGTPVFKLTRKKFIEDDSHLSFDEDFANNIGLYFSQGTKGRPISPQIRLWFDKFIKPRKPKQ